MGFKQLKVPISFDVYTQVGEYDSHPVYVSSSVPIEGVAVRYDNSFCINNTAYHALKDNKSFGSLVEAVCESLDRYPLYHEKPLHSFKGNAVIAYLKEKNILK